jgi:hypothetical protein
MGALALFPGSASAGEITGTYQIKNTNSGQCLSINGGNKDEERYMEQFTCGTNYNYNWSYQRFQFERTTPDGWFVIHPRSKSYLCLSLERSGFENGIPLKSKFCDGSDAQKFQLQFEGYVPNGGGNTRNKIFTYFGKCLQVDGASSYSYARVSQVSCSTPGYHLIWDFKWLGWS